MAPGCKGGWECTGPPRRAIASRSRLLSDGDLYIYIYIYRERERDVYIYIYIYIERETHTVTDRSVIGIGDSCQAERRRLDAGLGYVGIEMEGGIRISVIGG